MSKSHLVGAETCYKLNSNQCDTIECTSTPKMLNQFHQSWILLQFMKTKCLKRSSNCLLYYALSELFPYTVHILHIVSNFIVWSSQQHSQWVHPSINDGFMFGMFIPRHSSIVTLLLLSFDTLSDLTFAMVWCGGMDKILILQTF